MTQDLIFSVQKTVPNPVPSLTLIQIVCHMSPAATERPNPIPVNNLTLYAVLVVEGCSPIIALAV